MRVDKSLPGCSCPPGEDTVATDCMVHFGDGFGSCVPHEVDADEMLAAVDVCCGVRLCRPCRSAHFRAVHAVQA